MMDRSVVPLVAPYSLVTHGGGSGQAGHGGVVSLSVTPYLSVAAVCLDA